MDSGGERRLLAMSDPFEKELGVLALVTELLEWLSKKWFVAP